MYKALIIKLKNGKEIKYDLNNLFYVDIDINKYIFNYITEIIKLNVNFYHNRLYGYFPYTLINLQELYIECCYELKEIPNNLINLQKLTIDSCNNIKEIPNTLINLQELNIISCKKIIEIPDTLINLKELIIKECKNIKEIPNNLINLQKLYLKECNNIKEIPNTLINLKNLYIDDNNNIKEIPNNLINLQELNINKCYNLNKISKELINLEYMNIKNCRNIKETPIKLINLKEIIINNINLIKMNLKECINLKYLEIDNCSNIHNNFIIPKKNNINIETLIIKSCYKIVLPPLKNLKKLEIDNSKVKINEINNIEDLIICNYYYNNDILNVFNNKNNLKKITLQNTNFKYLPNKLNNLTYLDIQNTYIKYIPNDLINLSVLKLSYCQLIKNIPYYIFYNLETLYINKCGNIHQCHNLENYLCNLYYLKNLENYEYEYEHKYKHLKELTIRGCKYIYFWNNELCYYTNDSDYDYYNHHINDMHYYGIYYKNDKGFYNH